jgi:hypothetical protein
VSARVVVERLLIMVIGAGVAAAGCQRAAAPFDPAAQASSILAECGADSSCVRERWLRDPRGWNLGLRAEVAGRRPQAPFVVETTREVVTPELASSACLGGVTERPGLYYRTWIAAKDSDEFPAILFHWKSFNQAIFGHRKVVAAVADARGDAARLWRTIGSEAALDDACVRFRGKRDRCQVEPPAG